MASLPINFGAAIDSIGEGVMITDSRGRIVKVNPIALEMLGYSEKELLGKWMSGLITAYNADLKAVSLVSRPVVRSLITGKPVYDYVYYQSKQKKRIPVFISVAPIIIEGDPIGAIGIFRDISMEEAVDQMKSEFISLASHQLRTPLSSIKTYSHMLLDGYMGPISDLNRPALEIIVAATNRMNELISTLLNISRLESGAIVVERNKVDIARVAQEVMEDMAIPAKNRQIELKLSSDGSKLTDIMSDGPIIKEVLTNLVSNSVKYSRARGLVQLVVRGNPRTVSITVRDQGLGIPEPAKEQIFSKFFRAHNVIQIETSGTGLGLYLVKGLVDELGGKISFTSVEGQGTTFVVSLPRNL